MSSDERWVAYYLVRGGHIIVGPLTSNELDRQRAEYIDCVERRGGWVIISQPALYDEGQVKTYLPAAAISFMREYSGRPPADVSLDAIGGGWSR